MDNAQSDNDVMTLHPVKIYLAIEGVISDPPAIPPIHAYGLPLRIFRNSHAMESMPLVCR